MIEIDLMIMERFKRYCEFDIIQINAFEKFTKKLLNGSKIKVEEYDFLCWLSFNNSIKFPVTISIPKPPKIIQKSLFNFVNFFCINNERKELYDRFESFLVKQIEEYRLDYIDVLVGGSFVDENIDSPNDIDCVILLDEEIMNTEIVRDYDNKTKKDDVIDYEFINYNISFDIFWSYICLTRLGNRSKKRGLKNLNNNSFEIRDIYRLRFYSI